MRDHEVSVNTRVPCCARPRRCRPSNLPGQRLP